MGVEATSQPAPPVAEIGVLITDENGRFSDGLYPATYTVTAHCGDHEGRATGVVIRSNERTQVDVAIDDNSTRPAPVTRRDTP